MKLCSKCGVSKPDDGFYIRPNGNLHSWCKDCMKELRVSRNPEIAEYQRRRRAGRTGVERELEKDYQLQYNFGITLEEYRQMLEAQSYACAICGKKNGLDLHRPGTVKELSVDHCHRTHKVRGLLCNDCNRAIGQLQDSPELCRKAAEYLEHYARLHGRAAFDADVLLEELMTDTKILGSQ